MPAAAVIPAPIAYIKVVAVKKLVVEFFAAARVALVYSGASRARGVSVEVARPGFTPRARETTQLL